MLKIYSGKKLCKFTKIPPLDSRNKNRKLYRQKKPSADAEGQAKITAKHLINIIVKKRIIGFDLGFAFFINESIS